ncbi:HlyD family secretion protein [Psychrobium sp. 1_MG-2023]|uniref:HlyD family secretion protein n=1 Tax=Psychrobium sp. 1_MG-2023 TaxID=3062624 RepID=UPI0027360B1F|nr:HlyD family efflux transporter periplasmic adaptor subunit [Psychrobium sp. 1_MG-2023]MDP2562786.1 HlyD family efflux transporter periplasmic adaptor subunit [Psychrobium sp. 1_MG-2023]
MTLFRSEVLTNKADNLFGKAYLKIPISYSLFTVFLVFVTFAILSMLYFSNYSRKETVIGVLVPDKGLIRITAPRAANIHTLPVSSEESVNLGQHLLTLTSQTQLATGQGLTEQQIALLNTQIKSLTEQLNSEQQLSKERQLRQKEAIGEENNKIWQLSSQLTVSRELVVLKQQQFNRATKLAQNGHLTNSEKNNSYQEFLLQKQSHEEIKRQLMQQKSNVAQMKHEAKTLPFLLEKKLASLNNQITTQRSQLLQMRSQGAELIKSPIKGNISSILVNQGEQVTARQLLMTLIPENSLLEAELYIPSRASGFIQKGQQVRLRYQAFPYQRYGIFSGQVINISKTIFSPNELNVSVPLNEAVYKVKVALANHTIEAFGENHSLQPGMQLEADIVLDTMSLFDWLMMPIYAVKGTW